MNARVEKGPVDPPLDLDRAADLLVIANAAARASADLLKSRFGEQATPISKVGRDIKLEVDQLSDQLIGASLRKASSLPILSEETGWSHVCTIDELYWAVDPLDGSFNFHRGIPLGAVSVALCRGRSSLLGAVYDFHRDELFSGGPGMGMMLNGSPVVRPRGPAEILASGFPIRADYSESSISLMVNRALKWKKIRMLGSAALSLAWVAEGRFDGYEESGIMWWDIAAGVALGHAAGCSISVEGGALEGPLEVRVTSPPGLGKM